MTEVLQWWFDNEQVECATIVNALNNVDKKFLAQEFAEKFSDTSECEQYAHVRT